MSELGFSDEWDKIYQENRHMSVWPWPQIISLFHRYKPRAADATSVLEIGCGAGANIRFFASVGAAYYGVDGSETIIEKLQTTYPALGERLKVADFTVDLPFDDPFDVVIDRSSLTCNPASAIDNAVSLLYDRLTPGGVVISSDLFSVFHSEFRQGQEADDDHTRHEFIAGPFEGIGKVHFWDEMEIRRTFSAFEILHLQHRQTHNLLPDPGFCQAVWDVVVRKH